LKKQKDKIGALIERYCKKKLVFAACFCPPVGGTRLGKPAQKQHIPQKQTKPIA